MPWSPFKPWSPNTSPCAELVYSCSIARVLGHVWTPPSHSHSQTHPSITSVLWHTWAQPIGTPGRRQGNWLGTKLQIRLNHQHRTKKQKQEETKTHYVKTKDGSSDTRISKFMSWKSRWDKIPVELSEKFRRGSPWNLRKAALLLLQSHFKLLFVLMHPQIYFISQFHLCLCALLEVCSSSFRSSRITLNAAYRFK